MIFLILGGSNMDEFNIEDQYQFYLNLVGLKEDKMHPVQKKQTKMAFYGAYGQLLVTLKEDVSRLETKKAVKVLSDMLEQVDNFWKNEEKNHE